MSDQPVKVFVDFAVTWEDDIDSALPLSVPTPWIVAETNNDSIAYTSKKQRSSTYPESTCTSLLGASASPPVGMPSASEEDWERRTAHRQAGVTHIKSTIDYQRSLAFSNRPATPDPRDRRVSKRKWETSVQAWGAKLRELPLNPSAV